ncbi:hypothetical protein ACU70A_06480 [Syntrophomonas erecta subsp. sporosyntropha]
MRITQHYWNQHKVRPASKSNRPRRIAREEPHIGGTSHTAREREQLRKMEKTMDGIGWTALILAELVSLLVIYVQCSRYFYGW